jgi:bifunctional UDP-N-acetylglucosamine pyrophosphorylase / glucosamine-1-phosphate N-acetyltransferase
VTQRTAIILAGGESRRMNSRLSKVLHPILGYPVIRYVIDAAMQADVTRLVIVGNDKNKVALEQLIETIPNLNARVCLQESPRGTADAVSAAGLALGSFSTIGGSILVLCGDAPLIRGETLSRFMKAHEEGQMAVSVLSGEVKNPFAYGRIVRQDGRFVSIVEQKEASESERTITEINSGCVAFDGAQLDVLLKSIPAAANGEFYLTRSVDLALDKSLGVDAFSEIAEEEILGINTRGQLAAATKILKQRTNLSLMEQGVTLVDPESAFIDKRATIGRDTIIEPWVVIDGPVTIGEGCHIGPFARLRGACVVGENVALGNFVELVRSEVGADTRALHHAYIGDTQLGSRVNIGAGTIFANWDGEKKNKGFVEDGAFVGSGTIVVQPAGLSEGARTGAGAVVTRTVPAGETWVGVPARRFEKLSEKEADR